MRARVRGLPAGRRPPRAGVGVSDRRVGRGRARGLLDDRRLDHPLRPLRRGHRRSPPRPRPRRPRRLQGLLEPRLRSDLRFHAPRRTFEGRHRLRPRPLQRQLPRPLALVRHAARPGRQRRRRRPHAPARERRLGERQAGLGLRRGPGVSPGGREALRLGVPPRPHPRPLSRRGGRGLSEPRRPRRGRRAGAPADTAPLHFDAYAAADADSDGIITLDELTEVAAPTDDPWPDDAGGGGPGAASERPDTLGELVYSFLLPRITRLRGGGACTGAARG